jgi:hypothetical protein
VTPIDPKIPDGGVRFREGSTTVSLALFNDVPGQTRKVGSFTLSGLSAVAKYDVATGSPTRALLVQGTSLTDALHTLISQATPVQVLEADGLASGVLTLSGDATGQPRVYAPVATQVYWNKVAVSFRREGDYVVVTGTPAAPAPLAGQGPSSSSPTPGGSGAGGGDSGSSGPGPTASGPPSSPQGTGSSLLSVGPATASRGMYALSCSTYGRQLTAFWMGMTAGALAWGRRRRALSGGSRGTRLQDG